MFANVKDAIWALLGEATGLAHQANLPFAVIGGWSPFLLNSGPVRHPGTRDVDLLFSGGSAIGALADVFRLFVSAGYLPSAKHPFQVIRVLEVAGEHLAFNVDFLHPEERQKSADMFVDHLDLNLWLDERQLGKLRMKSIVTPVSQFIFDGHVEVLERQITLPDGSTQSVRIPVMDELGTLVTKADSAGSVKRHRDALDIYLAIAQVRSRPKLVGDARSLSMSHPEAFAALEHLRGQVDRAGGRFWPNFDQSVKEWNIGVSSQEARKTISSLFDDIGVTAPGGV
jgi:hypothetical protein